MDLTDESYPERVSSAGGGGGKAGGGGGGGGGGMKQGDAPR